MTTGVVGVVWFGKGLGPAAARLALRPLSAAFGVIVRARSALYDAGALRSSAPAIPVLSVGNLTVGGTGKTPVSAWLAARLSGSARTAVALRGYGGDEIAVHARLNPHVPVLAGADRLAAVAQAKARGAEIVVLDDGFQHRRLRATATVVLVSVEQLERPRRLMPAGPWRETLTAARRADLVMLTRKSASQERASRAAKWIAAEIGVPTAQVHLAPALLRRVPDGETKSLDGLDGAPVLAIAAIGEPDSFRRQLEALGAEVTLAAFRDHHDFTEADARALALRVPSRGLAVCTLKDAVKLAPLWAGSAGLWYLSQQLVVERGEADIDRLLERVLAARSSATFAG
jgi:tetraacyldisaccharide 4'-kinase